jgi:hypothetical protein
MNGVYCCYVSLGHHPLLMDVFFENRIPCAAGFIEQV